MTAPAPETRVVDLRTDAPSTDAQRDAYVTLIEQLTHALYIAEYRRRAGVAIENMLVATIFACVMLFEVIAPAFQLAQRITEIGALTAIGAAVCYWVWIARRTARAIRQAVADPIANISVEQNGRRIVAEITDTTPKHITRSFQHDA